MTRGKARKPSQRARGETRHLADAFRLEERALLAAFGARIRERRLAAGLTQLELGDWTFLKDTQVSAIERGVRRSTLPDLLLLADALNSPLTDLADGLLPPAHRDAREQVLASLAEHPANIQHLTETMGVPWAYARALVRRLAREELIEPRGGNWQLSRAAAADALLAPPGPRERVPRHRRAR